MIEPCAWCEEVHVSMPLAPPDWNCRKCGKPNHTDDDGKVHRVDPKPQTHLGHHVGTSHGGGEDFKPDFAIIPSCE